MKKVGLWILISGAFLIMIAVLINSWLLKEDESNTPGTPAYARKKKAEKAAAEKEAAKSELKLSEDAS